MSRRILSEFGTIALALSMAVLVWVTALREEDPTITSLYVQRLPVEVIKPAQNLVIANPVDLPPEIQVRLSGPRSSWQRLTPAKFKAKMDLSSTEIGVNTVPVEVTLDDPQMEIEEVIPGRVSVRLEPIAEKVLPANIRILGEPPRGFTYRLPSEPISVTIKGGVSSVETVERVEGQLVLNGVREAVERQVRLFPKNGEGETANNVTIIPDSTLVKISVEQRFGYNNVGVKAQVVGEPATGYFISRILTEPSELILRGPDQSPGFIETAEIDITNATETIVRRVPLIVPPGFSIEPDPTQDPEDSRSATVTIEISAFTDGRTLEKQVEVQGLDPSFTIRLEPETVELFLTGPWPVLQPLTADGITVFVDLFGLEPGSYRLNPAVIQPEEINVVSIIPDMIEVIIENQAAAPTDLPLESQPNTDLSVTATLTPTLQTTEGQTLTGTITNSTETD
jgi:YbbR domain-containing protein